MPANELLRYALHSEPVVIGRWAKGVVYDSAKRYGSSQIAGLETEAHNSLDRSFSGIAGSLGTEGGEVTYREVDAASYE